MIKILISFALLISIVEIVEAQEVKFRSGDHISFTRLTASIPPNTTWEIQQDAKTIKVSFDPLVARIDISEVFQKISRNRIEDILISAQNSSLTISLNCACEYESFMHNESLLVIDISENSQENSANGIRPLEANVNFPLFNHSALTDESPVLSEYLLESETHQIGKPQPVNAQKTSLLMQNSQSLRTAINLGISEGRLIKNYNFAESNNDTLPQLPVNVHSLPLMEFHPKNTQTPVESEQYNCPSSKLLNVSDWMYSEDFASGIGELSTNLHQDSSEIKNDLLSSLIKHFLHFGFGAEALALLSSNNSVFSEEEKGFLIGIAHIISLGYDPTLAFNNVTNECSGAAQLWSLLSSDEDYDFLSVDKSEVVFAFTSLPLQLRQLLGPLLALKLSENRNSSLAEQIMVMTNSKAAKINSSLYGAETLIPDRFSGPPDFSELQPLVAPDPDVIGISTLTETVFRSFELGTPLTRDTADLVGSYYLQFRESPHAENLEHAYILALAQSSQFTESLGYLTNESSSLSQENKHYVLDQILHALIKLPDDITFASIVLGTPPLTKDPELNFEIADRLLSLGFPERALVYLAHEQNGQSSVEHRVLRARAALSLQDPNDALSVLSGLSGDNIEELRKQAVTLQKSLETETQGVEERAQQRFLQVETPEEVAALPEVQVNPNLVSETNGLSVATQRDPDNFDSDDGRRDLVEETENLLNKSVQTRSAISQTLSDFLIDN